MNKYQKMMQDFDRAGLISYGQGDIVEPKHELERRMIRGMEEGLLKKVDPPEVSPKINQNFTMDAHDAYSASKSDVDRNTRNLISLGVPFETIAPFIQKRQMQDAMMGNLNRVYNPSPNEHSVPYLRSSMDEERRLGLDPSKFTKKSWNPSNYLDGQRAGVARSEDPSEEELRSQQEAVMGKSASTFGDYKIQMMRKLMGYAEPDDAIYGEEAQRAIKDLGWEVNAYGVPVVPEDDRKLLYGALKKRENNQKLNAREALIVEALAGSYKDL